MCHVRTWVMLLSVGMYSQVLFCRICSLYASLKPTYHHPLTAIEDKGHKIRSLNLLYCCQLKLALYCRFPNKNWTYMQSLNAHFILKISTRKITNWLMKDVQAQAIPPISILFSFSFCNKYWSAGQSRNRYSALYCWDSSQSLDIGH